MNRNFEPLFFYVANLDLVGALIEQEAKERGDLSDLAFCVHYDQSNMVGSGRIGIYRRSEGFGHEALNTARDNMQGRIWFLQNDTWAVERFAGNPTKVPMFYAEVAKHPDYREKLCLDLSKPICELRVWDLPNMPQFRRGVPSATEEVQLLLVA